LEKKIQAFTLKMIQKGLVQSAHDTAEGGIAVALAESCISGKLGAEIQLTEELRTDVNLFSESQSRIILSVSPEHAEKIKEMAKKQEVPIKEIGKVKGQELSITHNGKTVISQPITKLEEAWRNAIPSIMRSGLLKKLNMQEISASLP
jgi:phosphoribosylformylglycinamidine (FGAM) synthase-like enzyme